LLEHLAFGGEALRYAVLHGIFFFYTGILSIETLVKVAVRACPSLLHDICFALVAIAGNGVKQASRLGVI
jgi:hypothetical protein